MGAWSPMWSPSLKTVSLPLVEGGRIQRRSPPLLSGTSPSPYPKDKRGLPFPGTGEGRPPLALEVAAPLRNIQFSQFILFVFPLFRFLWVS